METNLEYKKLLTAKIVKMSKDIGKVDKDGKNIKQAYDYISSNQLMGILREKLEKYKLSIVPQITEHQTETFESNGKTGSRTKIFMDFEVMDLETGYFEIKKWIGVDQDFGGKDFQQACTTCFKYFCFQLFKFSDKDDDPDQKSTEVFQEADVMLRHYSKLELLTDDEKDRLNQEKTKSGRVKIFNEIQSRLIMGSEPVKRESIKDKLKNGSTPGPVDEKINPDPELYTPSEKKYHALLAQMTDDQKLEFASHNAPPFKDIGLEDRVDLLAEMERIIFESSELPPAEEDPDF